MGSHGPSTIPIAIVGMACRLPGKVLTPEELWDVLVAGENTWSSVPKERYNEKYFHAKDSSQRGRVAAKGGHFLDEDLSLFDAPFFGMTNSEAIALDPQQRMNLEVAYEALENAGFPLGSVAGKDVGVFVGAAQGDYESHLNLDPDAGPRFQSTGTHLTMQANRVSYMFDLRGPSISIDTACSSGLTAVHLAIQSLRNGECSSAIVGGSHLNFTPFSSISLSKMGLLSEEGRSFAFDSRASGGFGRGEGVAFLVLKPLHLALRDHDSIRAVIRQSGLSQDGKTPGITYPNGDAQADLIRQVYQDADLDPAHTPYIEAHGTGTAAGDPVEVKALYDAFCAGRERNPLYIGSLKSNIGHLENASGVASLVKSVLMLERGMIAPNADLRKLNPKIPFSEYKIKVPKSLIPWPSRATKRVSISNYGFGGSNAHLVVEHRDILCPDEVEEAYDEESLMKKKRPLIYTLSGHRPEAVQDQSHRLINFLRRDPDLYTTVRFASSLAGTLNARRSRFKYRGAAVSTTPNELSNNLRQVQPLLAEPNPRVAFVFTGQGAAWARMGQEFMMHDPFRASMEISDLIIKELGAEWSLLEELGRDEATSMVKSASISQAACTAIQIALVDTLQSWNIRPSSVVGHSSGEIAAAYCAGLLSAEECLAIAFHRGQVASIAYKDVPQKGAMAAIGDSASNVSKLLSDTIEDSSSAVIACYNSPSSVTISGDEPAVDVVVQAAKKNRLQATKLKVSVAYHSHHMAGERAQAYLHKLGKVKPLPGSSVRFFSSVRGQLLGSDTSLDEKYWVENMVSPVHYDSALTALIKAEIEDSISSCRAILEVGPHALMRTPSRQCLTEIGGRAQDFDYLPSMVRGEDSSQFLTSLAKLWSIGVDVDVNKVNGGLNNHRWQINLPPYPWNRSGSARFWHDTRLTRQWLHRPTGRDPLLGSRVPESPDIQPSWRNIVRSDELTWLSDHKFRGETLFPFAGFLMMAVKALRQMTQADEKKISGFWTREVKVSEALVIRDAEDTEMITSLCKETSLDGSKAGGSFSFHVSSADSAGNWVTHCEGVVGASLIENPGPFASPDPGRSQWVKVSKAGHPVSIPDLYKHVSSIGIDYGPTFALLSDAAAIDSDTARGTITASPLEEDDSVGLNPRILDAISHPFFAAMHHGCRELRKTIIPVAYKKAFIPRRMLDEPIDKLDCIGYVEGSSAEPRYSYRTRESEPKDGALDLFVEGIQFASYGNESETQSTNGLGISWRTIWQPLTSTIAASEFSRVFRKSGNDGDCQQGRDSPLANIIYSIIVEDPCLAILDTTNIGNVSVTQVVLDAIHQTPRRGSQLDVYDCAVNSVEALNKLKEQMSPQETHLNYRVLHSGQDPTAQGFEAYRYDLVLGSEALVKQGGYLENLKKLLKPYGRMVVVESVFPSDSISGDSSGSIMSANDQNWDQRLRASAFSGVDGVIPRACSHLNSSRAIISTSIPTESRPLPWSSAVVVESGPGQSSHIAMLITRALATDHGLSIRNRSITDVGDIDDAQLYIFLDFKPGSVLAGIQAQMFESVKRLMSAKNVLWFTANATSTQPSAQQVAGFCRSIRNERSDMNLINCNVEGSSDDGILRAVVQLQDIVAGRNEQVADKEFQLDKHGVLNIWRLVPYDTLDEFISRDTGHRIIKPQPLHQENRPLVLRVAGSKKFDGGFFDDQHIFKQPLGRSEVDIAVEAVGVNFKDALLALGSVKEGWPGAEVSGTVTNVGSDVTNVKVGDRVWGTAKDSFATHVRTWATSVVPIPEDLSFIEAASLPNSFCTAYYSLVDVGRLSAKDTILIHAAAGGLGQAAIMIAKEIGAEVFCTVSSHEKQRLLTEEFGIPETNIFYSRSTSFKDRIMEVTNGRGVDVILNSLAGDQLKATWECIAPLGRFLEVGKRDILANSSLGMKMFERNVTFAAIDLTHFPDERPQLVQRLLLGTNEMIEESQGRVGPIRPLQTFGFADIPKALRTVAGGKMSGKLVLIPQKTDIVLANTPLPETRHFRGDATYLVTGGNGGVGRNLCRWMAREGAGHVVAMSRSGKMTEQLSRLELEMAQLGTKFHLIQCDASKRDDVADVFRWMQEKELPAVRGVFHCAMVLQDVIFDRMTFDDYEAATKPKVDGAWNLQTHLENTDLDFFIMLSSTSYRVGNRTQAAYAAGGGFLEGLAHYRRNKGQKADAIELGLVLDAGVFEQNKEALKHLLVTMVQITIDSSQIIALCKAAIKGNLEMCPLIGAVVQPPELKPLFWMHNAPFSHVKPKALVQGSDGEGGGGSSIQKLSVSLKQAASNSERQTLVHAAVVSRFASILMVPQQEITDDKSFAELGIDSLVAVEVRTWVWQEIGVRVGSRDILGAKSLSVFVSHLSELLEGAQPEKQAKE